MFVFSVLLSDFWGVTAWKSDKAMGKPGTVKVGSPGHRPCRSPSCVFVFSGCCYPPTFSTAGTITSALWIMLILKRCVLPAHCGKFIMRWDWHPRRLRRHG